MGDLVKPPSWIVIEPPRRGWLSEDGKSVNYNIRIRKWHPGFWWAAFQMLVLKRDPLTRKADRR